MKQRMTNWTEPKQFEVRSSTPRSAACRLRLEAPHELLSAREYEVLLLLAAARSVSEIAAQLDLSVKTISTYRTRILEKMGMSSNAQLMRYAMQHELV